MSNPIIEAQIIEREISDLLAAFPALVEDEEFRLDAIEGQTGALEYLDKLLSKEREADAMEGAIKERIDALRARKDAASTRKEAIRRLMHRIMAAANLRKVPLAEATLSVRAVPPAVMVIDETKIPEQFWRHVPTLDKKSLAEELKAGHSVEGAILSNGGETISVRTA